uniref:Endo/exonuclease/phosphatase domain-containing protein n=1 Tax=Rhabditophanes sp. KR3021 TaxID=114890 RepID=A0AC35TX45_9BILA
MMGQVNGCSSLLDDTTNTSPPPETEETSRMENFTGFMDVSSIMSPTIQPESHWQSDLGNMSSLYNESDYLAELAGADAYAIYCTKKERCLMSEKQLRKVKSSSSLQIPTVSCQQASKTMGNGSSTNRLTNIAASTLSKKSTTPTKDKTKKLVKMVQEGRKYSYTRIQPTHPLSYRKVCSLGHPLPDFRSRMDDVPWDPISKALGNENGTFRRMELVQPMAGQDHSNSASFSIRCYNILSQQAAVAHLHMYTHLDAEKGTLHPYLQENIRNAKIVNELKAYPSDIICLQEVGSTFYKEKILPELTKMDYNGTFVQKSCNDREDGCAILWSNRFTLIQKKDIIYKDNIAGNQPNEDDKPQVGQIVELEVNCSSDIKAKLFVANTHIIYNPKRGDHKLAQLACLISHLQDMVLRCEEEHSYIMCGDFNMQAYSKMYNFVVEGKCNPMFDRKTFSGQIDRKECGKESIIKNNIVRGSFFDHKCNLVGREGGDYFSDLSHRLKFASVYQHYTEQSKFPEISTLSTEDAGNPDFIFYGVSSRTVTNSKVEITETPKLSLTNRLSLPTAAKLQHLVGPMPNRETGSDHLPLVAIFEIR